METVAWMSGDLDSTSDAALLTRSPSHAKVAFNITVDSSLAAASDAAFLDLDFVDSAMADSSLTSAATLLLDDPDLTTCGPPSTGKTGSSSSVSSTTPSSLSIPDDEVGLTPLEIRRKRNRESMQRARTRQRDGIETMKITVQQLETQFRQLSDRKDRNTAVHPSTASTTASSTTVHNRVATSAVDVEAKYRVLADASRRLKDENYLLEKMLTEKFKAFRRLQQAMVDRKTECGIDTPLEPTPAETKPMLRDVLTSAAQFFTPISEAQADEAIKRCYDDIVRLEKLSQPLRNTAIIPPTATFGWHMACHILPEDDGFFVAFTKTFADVTPAHVMLTTWTLFSRPEYNSGSEHRGGSSDSLRLETLQVVNENAIVFARDIQHPVWLGKTLRTLFLRFRLQTEQGGFVIGRACMNPTNTELRALEESEANVVYGDFSSWIEFRSTDTGCEVKFGAILAYDTHEDMQLRLVNALMTTIAWETAVIKPVFCLQDSSE